MSNESEKPNECPEIVKLHVQFESHVKEEARWQKKLWEANKKLRTEVGELNDSIVSNKAHLTEIQKDIAGVVLAWEGLQGALVFFSAVGRVVKGITAMAAFFGGIYYYFKWGVPPKG